MLDQILGTAASVAGGIAGIIGGRETNDANAKQAHLNRDFQQQMSSTSHQREVEDLKAAGLNPILSANAGASTPGGSQATMTNPLESLASSARDAMQFALQAEKQTSEIGLLKAQTNKAKTETAVISKDVPKAEIINEIYQLIRPGINKIKEMINSNSASKLPGPNSIQRSEQMDKALERLRSVPQKPIQLRTKP